MVKLSAFSACDEKPDWDRKKELFCSLLFGLDFVPGELLLENFEIVLDPGRDPNEGIPTLSGEQL